jgi:hypothetical protein
VAFGFLIGFVSFDFGLTTVSSCFLIWLETVRDQPVPTLHDVLYGLLHALFPEAYGKPLEEIEQLRLPVENAPKASLIALPMFIDIGNEDEDVD